MCSLDGSAKASQADASSSKLLVSTFIIKDEVILMARQGFVELAVVVDYVADGSIKRP